MEKGTKPEAGQEKVNLAAIFLADKIANNKEVTAGAICRFSIDLGVEPERIRSAVISQLKINHDFTEDDIEKVRVLRKETIAQMETGIEARLLTGRKKSEQNIGFVEGHKNERLTPAELRILAGIQLFYGRNKRPPSTKELGKELEMFTSNVIRGLRSIEKKTGVKLRKSTGGRMVGRVKFKLSLAKKR